MPPARRPTGILVMSDFQLDSWGDLNSSQAIVIRGMRSKHVASVFFRTKEVNLDPDDHKILLKVAKLFAYATKKNKGLQGSVVGHADSVSSKSPNNQLLSYDRARFTARQLQRAIAAESRVIVGHIELSVDGNGDAAAKRDSAAQQGDKKTLAKYRRVDIFIRTGHAAALPPKVHHRPPNLKDLPPFADVGSVKDVMKLALNGDERSMVGLFRAMIAHLAYGGSSRSEVLFWSTIRKRIKPPWWDDRFNYLHGAHGKSKKVQEFMLLVRDYREMSYWEDQLFDMDKGGSYLKWMAGQGPKSTAVTEGGYYLYISDHVNSEAVRLHKLLDK